MHPRNYLRNTVQILIALVFASLASQSLTGASKSKIGAVGSGYWALDQNGNNAWDGTSTDGVYSWTTGNTREIAVQGDWNGDGRTKMGVYLDGVWILDYNGNGVWDGPDVDKVFTFGSSDFVPIVGDWNHTGWTKIGIHGISNSAAGQFLLDYNGNFAWDGTTVDKSVYWSLGNTGEIAVIGDWNGDGNDKIGIYSGGYWVLDYNGNNAWDGSSVDRDVYWSIDSHDIPVVGNWNGQLNSTKIGVYSDGHWMADYNGNFILDGQTRFAFFGGGNSTFLPAVGDWNDDGKTKIAAYLITSGTWWIEKSGNWLWDGPSIDVYTSFGGPTYVKPIVGAWPMTISGHATASGYPLIGATMNLSGSSSAVATTDNSGSYSFGVTPGGNYTVTPSEGGFAFSPSSLSWNNVSANETADFPALPADYPAGSGPVSIPNSFTAPDPVLTCDDISGVWDEADEFGNHVGWELTQTGALISGQMAYVSHRNGVDCGTVTYDVTGSFNSSTLLYSLSATIKGDPYDSCNLPVRTQSTATVTLSGRACGTGSGHFDTSPPGGSGLIMRRALPSNSRREGDNPSSPASPSQQLRATAPMSAAAVAPRPRDAQGSSIWTTISPRFTVQYSSYIPVDHIAGPLPCLVFFPVIGPVAAGWKTYKGDAFRGTYRTTESLLVVPGAQKYGNLSARGGPTRNYQIPSSPANGFFANLSSTPTRDFWRDPYVGADEDETSGDCDFWNAKGEDPNDQMRGFGVIFGNPITQVTLYGFGKNILEPSLFGLQGIKWNLTISLDSMDPAHPKAWVSGGTATCYPEHIVKVNGIQVFDQPTLLNNVAYLGACLSAPGLPVSPSPPKDVPAH